MIQHIVMLNPASEDGLSKMVAAMGILAEVGAKIPGMTGFQHGPNRDFEGKSQAYPYGFICTFTDKAALDAYAADPDHQRAGGILVANCAGGHEGIFVVDLEV